MESKRGRPKKFAPTENQRAQVVVWRVCGGTREFIAAEMGITVPTLDKHFMRELMNAEVLMRAQAIGPLLKRASNGDAGAQERLLKLFPPGPMDPLEQLREIVTLPFTLNMGDKKIITGKPEPTPLRAIHGGRSSSGDD